MRLLSEHKDTASLITLPVPTQEVLKALQQNRVGKDNAAVEFSRTTLLERTWPRIRSVATLYILALTLPVSICGCLVLVAMHLLKGGRLVAFSPHPTNKTGTHRHHPTAIVTGMSSQLSCNAQPAHPVWHNLIRVHS